MAPGRFLFGSTADEETRRSFFNTAPLHQITTESFLIARNEVTYEEWIAFLRTLPPEERARRSPRVQGLTGALELKELPGETWQLSIQPTVHAYTARIGEKIHYQGRSLRADQSWLRFPVSGISPEDAEAYVRWLDGTGSVPGAATTLRTRVGARGARRGRPRLPAREPPRDRRRRHRSDVRERAPGVRGPDGVGSHPASRSPFGLDDMCGNVFEWTRSSLAPNEHVLRGGGFYYDMTAARIPNRQIARGRRSTTRTWASACA